MSSFGDFLHSHFVPSKGNSYRPHILRREWLLFFIAVIIFSEGIFVSHLFVGQPPQGAAGQESVELAAVAGVSSIGSFADSVGRAIIRFLGDAAPGTQWMLGLIAALMCVAVVLAFIVHVQIQHPQMLFSGALVGIFSLSLLVTNIQIIGML